jgi:signal transduction histidine kinase
MFERFRKGAVHSPRGGHGLGLALARAIAQRHGLDIRAEDNHPGVRFVIEPE